MRHAALIRNQLFDLGADGRIRDVEAGDLVGSARPRLQAPTRLCNGDLLLVKFCDKWFSQEVEIGDRHELVRRRQGERARNLVLPRHTSPSTSRDSRLNAPRALEPEQPRSRALCAYAASLVLKHRNR